MADTASSTLNDVDLPSVGALIGAIQQDPTRAATTWNAEVSWKGGFRSEATVRDFGPIPSDEPPGLGGTNTAPNPVEQLLAALGNCLAVGYAANATAQNIILDELSIGLEGEIDLHTFLGLTDGNAGFENIRATVRLVSDADPDKIEALHAKVAATSPVGHTLARAVPLTIAPA
jgi:uncharacterized OsmC-like protein